MKYAMVSLVLVSLLLVGGVIFHQAQVTALAQQSQQDYDLSWHTIDGGGHTWSTGGAYALGGTVGQPDAGELTGGTYTLGGGFWEGGVLAEVVHKVYLPLIMRSVVPW